MSVFVLVGSLVMSLVIGLFVIFLWVHLALAQSQNCLLYKMTDSDKEEEIKKS